MRWIKGDKAMANADNFYSKDSKDNKKKNYNIDNYNFNNEFHFYSDKKSAYDRPDNSYNKPYVRPRMKGYTLVYFIVIIAAAFIMGAYALFFR